MTLGKSSGSPPAAPDPSVTAAAQTAANVDTARYQAAMNRVNQLTPQGTLTYTKAPSVEWDEQAYLAANPDVAQSFGFGQDGYFKSGLDHYNRMGKTEGRAGVPAGYGDPMNDQWTSTVTYSPEQQRLYDLATKAQTVYGETGLAQLGQLRQQMSTPFQFTGAPDYQDVASRAGQVQSGYDTGGPIQRSIGADDYSADRLRVEDALYGRLDPSLTQQRTALETRLRSQGLAPGSEAWTNAMRAQAQTENDARLGVVAAGGQEQSRLFGIDQARGQFANDAQAQQYGQNAGLAAFGNQAANQQQNMDLAAGQYGAQTRQQMLAEQLALRNQPLNETAALLSGQQVQAPQFSAVPQVQVAPTDVQGAYNTAYQGQLANYQGKTATNNANTGAAAGTAAAAVTAAAIII